MPNLTITFPESLRDAVAAQRDFGAAMSALIHETTGKPLHVVQVCIQFAHSVTMNSTDAPSVFAQFSAIGLSAAINKG